MFCTTTFSSAIEVRSSIQHFSNSFLSVRSWSLNTTCVFVAKVILFLTDIFKCSSYHFSEFSFFIYFGLFFFNFFFFVFVSLILKIIFLLLLRLISTGVKRNASKHWILWSKFIFIISSFCTFKFIFVNL